MMATWTPSRSHLFQASNLCKNAFWNIGWQTKIIGQSSNLSGVDKIINRAMGIEISVHHYSLMILWPIDYSILVLTQRPAAAAFFEFSFKERPFGQLAWQNRAKDCSHFSIQKESSMFLLCWIPVEDMLYYATRVIFLIPNTVFIGKHK